MGSKLFVWVGALALAAAAIYFAKYSIEKGLVSPPIRLAGGFAFAAALLGVGEWLRRRSPHVAQGLSAAGVAVLFTNVWAGVNLYDLIPPTAGFVILAVVTALAVFLSLRQGPVVAVIGLIGGFLTPVLVRSGEHQPEMFLYLLLLQAGLMFVVGKRGWAWMAVLTMLGGFGWALIWLATMFEQGDVNWIGGYLLGSAAVFVAAARHAMSNGPSQSAWVLHAVSWVAAVLGFLLLGGLTVASDFVLMDWVFLGVLGAGSLVLVRVDLRYRGLEWVAAAASLTLLAGYAAKVGPDDASRFGTLMIGFGLLYAVGGYACLWRSGRAGAWSAFSAAAGLACLFVAYLRLEGLVEWAAGAWGWIYFGCAAAYVAAAVPIYMRRAVTAQAETALAALAVAATALISLIAPIELAPAWIAVAWAIEIPLLALIEQHTRVRALRAIAASLAVGVMIRLILNGNVLDYPIGEHLIFNWLTFGYGIPMVCFVVGAWRFGRLRDDGLVKMLEAGAIAFLMALATLLIRHGFHPDELQAPLTLAPELVVLVNVWLALAVGITAIRWRLERASLRVGGAVVAILAAAGGGLFLVMYSFNADRFDAGNWSAWTTLLTAHLPSAGLAVAAAWQLNRLCEHVAAIDDGTRTDEANQAARSVAGVLGVFVIGGLFLGLTHGVHLWFEDSVAADQVRPMAEAASLTCLWLLFGLLLLAASRVLRHPVIRFGAFTVLAAATAHVLVAQLLIENPLVTVTLVAGPRIFNALLYAYGLPACGFALVGWMLGRLHMKELGRLAGVISMVLLLALITLEVRHWYQGENLKWGGDFENAEMYAYSAAWIVYGAGLLVAGVITRGATLRWASLVIMLLSTAKVFLWDTRHLEGLYRVVAFLMLGLTLMALGYVYHRFVFALPAEQAPDDSDDVGNDQGDQHAYSEAESASEPAAKSESELSDAADADGTDREA